MREKTESELVMREYRNICVNGSWLDRLLCPIRGLLCNGIRGANGEEREVRTFRAEENKALHDAAIKYDEHAEEVFRQLQMVTAIIASFAHGELHGRRSRRLRICRPVLRTHACQPRPSCAVTSPGPRPTMPPPQAPTTSPMPWAPSPSSTASGARTAPCRPAGPRTTGSWRLAAS